MGIGRIFSKLLRTVGILAVRLDLAKIRLKNWKEKAYFHDWKTTKKLPFLTKIWISKITELPPLQKMKKFVKKQIFLEVMGMDSNWSKLLKTFGLLAVRHNLAELRWKNRKKI